MSAKPMTKKEWQEYIDKAWGEAVKAAYKDEIEAAVLAEREACAKVCDRMASRCNDIRAAALESAAENIRARGQA